jgi:hypothetical protein
VGALFRAVLVPVAATSMSDRHEIEPLAINQRALAAPFAVNDFVE